MFKTKFGSMKISNKSTVLAFFFKFHSFSRGIGGSKFTYNGQEITFDEKGMWSFGNGFARNRVIIWC